VKCWGKGAAGSLGYGNTDDIGDDETPASVDTVDVGATVVLIDSGQAYNCVLTTLGTVRCWGMDDVGELGYGLGPGVTYIGDDETPASMGDVPLLKQAPSLVASAFPRRSL
jgi:alpha-tubulin suppressor-like RCC1 family protein